MMKRTFRTDKARLEELIEEATVDCHDEEEQMTGFWSCLEEEVVCPFRVSVAWNETEVIGLNWEDAIAVRCRSGKKTYDIDLGSIEFIEPFPKGYEWIEAYLLWRSRNL